MHICHRLRYSNPNIRHHCSWPNSHVFLVKSSFVMAKSLTGWWLSHPSEKYESQLGLFPTEWKNKIHVTNHQPVKFLDDLSFHGQIPPCVFLKSPFVVKFLLLAMERAAENGWKWMKKPWTKSFVIKHGNFCSNLSTLGLILVEQ